MSSKYKIIDHQDAHFITFATVQWVDLLTRPTYKNIIIDSLNFCIEKKGLRLFAYVIMTNHLHLIMAAKAPYNLSAILRDFKKYTSKQIFSAMQNNPYESRKSWMNWIFKSAGKQNCNNKVFQIWQQNNHPIQLTTPEMFEQRLDYLHNNPVKSGIVGQPHHYLYSSALDYSGEKGLVKIELFG